MPSLPDNIYSLMKTLKSAVVISTIARPKGTIDCLISISKSEKLPEFVVVVDASSTSEISDALMKFSKEISIPVLRIASGPGLPRQRNIGIHEALNRLPSLQIIHFLDDDVTVESSYFSEIEKVFFEHPDAVIVGGRDLNLHPPRKSLLGQLILTHSKLSGSITRAGNNTINFSEIDLVETQWLSGYSQSYRTEVFHKHLFNEQIRFYGEEIDMQVRCADLGVIYFSSRACLTHHESQVGRPRLSDTICWTDGARWHLCKENRPRFSFFAFYYSLFAHLFLAVVMGIFPRKTRYREIAKGHMRFILRRLRSQPLRQSIS